MRSAHQIGFIRSGLFKSGPPLLYENEKVVRVRLGIVWFRSGNDPCEKVMLLWCIQNWLRSFTIKARLESPLSEQKYIFFLLYIHIPFFFLLNMIVK